jgi:hypothetical protein
MHLFTDLTDFTSGRETNYQRVVGTDEFAMAPTPISDQSETLITTQKKWPIG